jgi:hypothetical protein
MDLRYFLYRCTIVYPKCYLEFELEMDMQLRISTDSGRIAQMLRSEGAQFVGVPPNGLQEGMHRSNRGYPSIDDMEFGLGYRGGPMASVPLIFEMIVDFTNTSTGMAITGAATAKAVSTLIDAADKILGIIEKVRKLREGSSRSINVDITITGASSFSAAERARLTEGAMNRGESISFKP